MPDETGTPARFRYLDYVWNGWALAWSTYPMLYTESLAAAVAEEVLPSAVTASPTVNYYKALKRRNLAATYDDLLFDTENVGQIDVALWLHHLASILVAPFPFVMMVPPLLADHDGLGAGAALSAAATFGKRNYTACLLLAALIAALPLGTIGAGLALFVKLFRGQGQSLFGLLMLPYALGLIFLTVIAYVAGRNALWLAYLDNRLAVTAYCPGASRGARAP